jgi:hypothetical protein
MGCLVYKRSYDLFNKNEIPENLWELEVLDIDRNSRSLAEFKKDKKLFLFINVACR